MAWSAPMTAVANTAFTAAQFNQFIRDNLLETAPAKATTPGSYFSGTGLNEIAERFGATDSVLVSESLTSDEWSDLPTPGPSVTVETGQAALVVVHGSVANTGGNGSARMSYEVTGETEYEGADNRGIGTWGNQNTRVIASGVTWHGPDSLPLNPGQNTFTAKYRVSSGEGEFLARRIIVLPF